jgi:hypothetical protein
MPSMAATWAAIFCSASPVRPTSFDAGLDLTRRVADVGLDLLGGVGGALGQGPHLLGHDGEAAPGFTRAGGFDAGVQRQQIGLEGDLVDHADDLGHLGGRGFDTVDRVDRVAHHLTRALGFGLGLAHGLASPARAVGGATDGGGDLVEGGGGFFQAGGLLLGAARQVAGFRGDAARAGVESPHRVDHGAHGVLQASDGLVEVGAQAFVVGRERRVEADGEVAVGKAAKAFGQAGDHQVLSGGLGRVAILGGETFGLLATVAGLAWA